jgi:hypothetical protein
MLFWLFSIEWFRRICRLKKNVTSNTDNNSKPQISMSGVSKWVGTRYFYPPEIVYSTGRNY